MTRIGTLDTIRLSALLQRIKAHHKTGIITIKRKEIQDEIYLVHGEVTVVISDQTRKPLVKRLLDADVITIHQLRHLPAETGRMLGHQSASQQENDEQAAIKLLQHGLIDRTNLLAWYHKEAEQELQKLMEYSEGQIYFEERNDVPGNLLEGAIDAIIEGQPTHKLGGDSPTIDAHDKSRIQSAPTEVLEDNNHRSRSAIMHIPGIRSISRSLDMHTVKVAVPSKPNPLFRWETVLILALLLVAGLAHGINMFHYPYFEDDEGTYLSQAWAVLHMGRLAYYTYWYDHAPAGWIQIAGWLMITGGFRTFGSAMNSGRVFMLVLQLGSCFILYRIARIISKSWLIATIVVLLFALSPYGLYYHRRILLDNIMTFWMLLSIFFLVLEKFSLKNACLSAICLAISILSKEVTAFLIPAFTYFVWIRTDKVHRTVVFTSWVIIVFAILSGYPLIAVLKGELFPSGTILGGNNPHVSLLGSLSYQGSRGGAGSVFDLHSYVWNRFITWTQDDPILVIGGSLSAFISLFFIRKYPLIAIIGFSTLSLWAFLARGGVIIDFYFIPLLPLLALNFGLVLGLAVTYLQKYATVKLRFQKKLSMIIHRTLVIACVASLLAIIPSPIAGVGYGTSNVGDSHNPFIYWNNQQTDGQIAAIDWVEQHIPKNDRIVIDMYMWPELYTNGYTSAHYYWKVDEDPAIRIGVFHNNWRYIDYIVTTPEMTQDVNNNNMQILEEPIRHSKNVVNFDTGGWKVQILKVDKH